MNLEIKNIHSFINAFKNYLEDCKKIDVWVYSRKKSKGSLLLKNFGNKKIILVKPSDSINPIGAIRIEKIVGYTKTFRKKIIDSFVFISNIFKDNAQRLSKVDKRITLISVNNKKKEITIFGSMNLDLNILNHFVEFADVIKYSISYDFEGLLKHQGFQKDKSKPIVKVQSRSKNPRVFFSYSWDNDQHKLWVLKLASDLIRTGIDVLIDEWDLDKYGNDLHQFMESGIRDSDKIVMICTPAYLLKANERLGGVGVESTIISGEFYDKEKANKYLSIVKNYKKNIHECLPSYLKSKYSIDFNKEDEYKLKLNELIRKILNVPQFKKPKLGELPNLEPKEI